MKVDEKAEKKQIAEVIKFKSKRNQKLKNLLENLKIQRLKEEILWMFL